MSKISIEEVKCAVEKDGCILISTEYKNLETDLEIQCEKGHTFFKKYKAIRKDGCKCPICGAGAVKGGTTSISKPKTKKYRILALDQATLTTGWSLWDDGELVGYGLLTVPSGKTDTIARINYIKQWLISMIENNSPDLVLLEDIQLQEFHSNKKSDSKFDNVGITTFKVLAKLQGVLESCLREQGVSCKIVFSQTWRAKVGVKGARRPDRKRSAQLIVSNLYNIRVSEDEADAILIGKYGSLTYKKDPTMVSWE